MSCLLFTTYSLYDLSFAVHQVQSGQDCARAVALNCVRRVMVEGEGAFVKSTTASPSHVECLESPKIFLYLIDSSAHPINNLFHINQDGWFKVWLDKTLEIDESGLKTWMDIDDRLFQFRVGVYPNWLVI